jgi:hypothetical protein
MCSLAATGQLGGPQMSELNEHVAGCESCRNFLASVAQASMQVMPTQAESRMSPASFGLPEGMRTRFLSRLEAEASIRGGATPIPFPVFVQKRRPHAADKTEQRQPEGVPLFSQRGWLALWRPAAIFGACVLVGMVGFYVGQQSSIRMTQSGTLRVSRLGSDHSLTQDPPEPLVLLERQKTMLDGQLVKMKEKLSAADAQERELAERLADADRKLTSLMRQQESRAVSLEEKQPDKAQIAILQSEAETLRSQLQDFKAKQIAEQTQNEELKTKLAVTEENLQQELGLKSAKNEMGDLVASRNLHIVDVYDADPNGKRQRSFGRVFYVEGKSLVFYAYDLDVARQVKSTVVFHVWGGKAGVKEITHNLGILHKDDAGQSRWTMTFDDPKILAQINSVFVTAEAPNRSADEPRGKRVLYAYLGSQPNHP